MNWLLPKSTTLGTNNSMQNGMGWLRIDVDMFLFLPQRLPQYLLLESSQQPVPLHTGTDVLEDSFGRKVTTAPLYHPHERHNLRFFHPLSVIFLQPCVLLSMLTLHVESTQHLRFENDTGSRRTKVPRACLPLLLRTCKTRLDVEINGSDGTLEEMIEAFESKSAGCWPKYISAG